MKIREARQTYNYQIRSYNEQKRELSKQKNELEKKMKYDPDNKTVYAGEAAILELTIDAVSKKQQEYQDYMDKLMEQEFAIVDMESGKQQCEAMEEYAKDLGKIFEVARRLMKGATVPPNDEKKLMEYSMEMYQAAKNIGAMVKRNKKEEYDSLWDEEEAPEEPQDPMEIAENSEAFASGPEVVDVADTMASVEMPSVEVGE